MNDFNSSFPVSFTPEQTLALQALHTRYQQDHDHFSDRERARLLFLRWLYEAGQLDPPLESRATDANDDPADEQGGSRDSEPHDADDRRHLE